jgi:sugar O-acyltransferase (sialic acid O-acetyltransferase NeuD family)
MLVIGALGFAKQLLSVLSQLKLTKDLYFYDDVNSDAPDLLYDVFPILHTFEEAKIHFGSGSKDFIIGVGGVRNRFNIYHKFSAIGGNTLRIISPTAILGDYDCRIEDGVSILHGSVIENSVHIGKGTLVNLHSLVTHDSVIGEFCELSPGVKLSGRCQIGDYTTIGTGAIILPGIRIGQNAIIGAGSVVTRDVESYKVVTGVPATVVRDVRDTERVIYS